jgi:hypothetical protein
LEATEGLGRMMRNGESVSHGGNKAREVCDPGVTFVKRAGKETARILGCAVREFCKGGVHL